jgi:hypothetical protein
MLAVRAVFYASYRDVYDALYSAKQRVDGDFMHQYLRKRGIVLPGRASRHELVDAIAAYAYDVDDLDEICDQLEAPSRADRVSYSTLSATVAGDIINEAVESVKQIRAGRSEVLRFHRSPEGRIELDVDYYEIDPGKTLLRQQRPRQAKIEFMSVGSGMRVRIPGAERISEIASLLLEEIEKRTPQLEQKSIDVSTFGRLERTEFFQLLIQKLGGMRTVDVKKVNVDRDTRVTEFAPPDDLGGFDPDDDEPADEGSTADSARAREVSEEVKNYLNRCSLSGSGILRARLLKRFLASEFFISRIVWEVQPRSSRSELPKAEIEALLEDPAEGLGFRYMVRNVYPRKRNKAFASTKRRPTDIEREKLLDLIELASQEAYTQVAARQSATAAGE